MDICAKIQQLPGEEDQEDVPLSTIYYFEKCGYNLERNKLS